MKTVRYETKGTAMFVRVNTLDDVLDLRRFGNTKTGERIVSWKKLFGVRDEALCKQKAKGIVRRMLELVAQDMIHGKDAFVFPKQGFGYMSIGRLDGKHDTSRYTGAAQLVQSATYGGLVTLTKEAQWENGRKRYFFKLVTPLIEQIRELRRLGHTW